MFLEKNENIVERKEKYLSKEVLRLTLPLANMQLLILCHYFFRQFQLLCFSSFPLHSVFPLRAALNFVVC